MDVARADGRRRRSERACAALLVLGALALPACGSDSEAAELQRSTTTTSTTTTGPDHDDGAADDAAHRPARDRPGRGRPAGARGQDRQRRDQPRPGSAPGRAQPGRRRLRGAGRGRHHPVPDRSSTRPTPTRSARCARPARATSPSSPRSTIRCSPGRERRSWVVPRVHASGAVDVGHDARPPSVLPPGATAGRRTTCTARRRRCTGRPRPGAGTPPPHFIVPGAEGRPGRRRPAGRRGRHRCSTRRAGAVPVAVPLGPGHRRMGPVPGGHAPRRRGRVQVAPQNVIVQFVPYGFDSPAVPLAEVIGTGRPGCSPTATSSRPRGRSRARRRSRSTSTPSAARSVSPRAAPGWPSCRPAAPPSARPSSSDRPGPRPPQRMCGGTSRFAILHPEFSVNAPDFRVSKVNPLGAGMRDQCAPPPSESASGQRSPAACR